MLVKEMFKKPIDRPISAVVKPGKTNPDILKQELEEYVVTKQMQKQFKDFFSAYQKGIDGNTDEIGVWISGDYGSGKSHMLKMLSYILSNNKIHDKYPIDYFLDDNKIDDQMTIAQMKKAFQTSTDSILFDIDAKSKNSGRKDKRVLINTFMTVFNEHLGYCSSNPYVAELERELEKQDKYDEFKTKYSELTNKMWEESRHSFGFIKGKVAKVLTEINFMDEVSAKAWIESTKIPYAIEIEGFAKLVKKYIDKKENNHHIVFFVDEVSQYIGQNTDLLLNLQTLVHQLGIYCSGKAWVVVTSQVAINQFSNNIEHDYSKIQGRFDTKIILNSADVAQVIKKRILDKNETAKETLKVIYEQKEAVLRNMITFNDTAEKKFYKNSIDFYEVYPFIPYQFDIISLVIKAIKANSTSGKYQSQGERSMLALFKFSAESLMQSEDDALVSLNKFYEPLSKDLDNIYSSVIDNAYKNTKINPNGDEKCFNVEVLKVLLMIKHVDQINKNIDNITTLMISKIDDDRFILREKVTQALDILTKQTLIQKDGDVYIFLTNQEQEVERMIENQDVESSEITTKISSEIFDSIYAKNKYTYPEYNNRYVFSFYKEVDGHKYRELIYDIGVSIVTPMSEYCGQDKALRMMSSDGKVVYISLPDDDLFIKEIRQALKIEKFLTCKEARNLPRSEEITAVKSREMGEHRGRAARALEEALKNAQYYVNSDRLNNSTKDFKAMLKFALGKVVSLIYSKLYYMTAPKDDIDIRNLFKNNLAKQIVLKGKPAENENAIRDLMEYINLKTRSHAKISMKDIKDKFKRAPYGFLDVDIEWLIAKCFKDGRLEFTVSGNSVSLINETPEKIIDFITKKMYTEKLLLSPKTIINPKHVKVMKKISKELFKSELTMEDTDAMVVQFNKNSHNFNDKVNKLLVEYRLGKYPSKKILELGKSLFEQTLNIKSANEVFEYVFKKQDDYTDFGEDFAHVKLFFEGNQKKMWESLINLITIYTDSKNYFVNSELEAVVSKMKRILSMASPYYHIKELPELCEKFRNLYNNDLDKELEPVIKQIEIAHTRVSSRLKETDFTNEFIGRYNKAFSDLKDKAKCCNNIKDVNGFKLEADSLKKRFLVEIDREVAKRLPPKPIATEGNHEIKSITPPVVRRKTLYVSDVYNNSSWQIKNEKDLEAYLEQIRKKIKVELKDDVIINIEF